MVLFRYARRVVQDSYFVASSVLVQPPGRLSARRHIVGPLARKLGWCLIAAPLLALAAVALTIGILRLIDYDQELAWSQGFLFGIALVLLAFAYGATRVLRYAVPIPTGEPSIDWTQIEARPSTPRFDFLTEDPRKPDAADQHGHEWHQWHRLYLRISGSTMQHGIGLASGAGGPNPEAERNGRRDEMDEILTVGEMESKFVAEWLLVEDPETDETLEVRSGKVRFHSKDRDEVYRKAVELHPRRFAVLYTGSLPKDAAVVL